MRLSYQFELIKAIKEFFNNGDFLEVMTPPIVENPGMEPHIHPFQIKGANPKSTFPGAYLHTSPEFEMKYLLSLKDESLDKIYNLSYVFRDEPDSPIHRNQFRMLEWYRKGAHYHDILNDTKELIDTLAGHELSQVVTNSTWQYTTVQELIFEFCKFDILNFLDKQELKEKIHKDFTEVPLPSVECAWDDYFFLLFLNLVEPHFENIPKLIVDKFPTPLAALATLDDKDNRVANRFEIYLAGLELANCYQELTDLKTQKERFQMAHQEKKELYGYELPEPKRFYESLERGLPESAGIALGVDRLLCWLLKSDSFY